jgi:hypothetical protein
MKKQYPKGATWEAKMKGVLYKIVYDDCYPFGMMFCVYITRKDGFCLSEPYWENYDQLGTIRAATRFCRNRFYLPLRFRRVK